MTSGEGTKRGTHDVHGQGGLLAEDGSGPVDDGDVAQDARAEPDATARIQTLSHSERSTPLAETYR